MGSPQERNEILKLSHRLTKGESLDKYVPKRYEIVYKRFKKEAWKLRKFHSLKTNIDFNGHILTLKYKQPDKDNIKFGWTIHEEWSPEPTDSVVPQTQQTGSSEGILPTPVLQTNTDKSFLISGLKVDQAITPEEIKDAFLELLGDDKSNVETVRPAGTTLVVQCSSKEQCLKLRQKYRDKKLFNCTPVWTLESEA